MLLFNCIDKFNCFLFVYYGLYIAYKTGLFFNKFIICTFADGFIVVQRYNITPIKFYWIIATLPQSLKSDSSLREGACNVGFSQ